MKFRFLASLLDWALPLHVFVDVQKSHWLVIVHFLCFGLQAVHVNMPSPAEIEAAPETVQQNIKATKAYADQRQKAKRNRRRKPKKAMEHLYQLQ